MREFSVRKTLVKLPNQQASHREKAREYIFNIKLKNLEYI